MVGLCSKFSRESLFHPAPRWWYPGDFQIQVTLWTSSWQPPKKLVQNGLFRLEVKFRSRLVLVKLSFFLRYFLTPAFSSEISVFDVLRKFRRVSVNRGARFAFWREFDEHFTFYQHRPRDYLKNQSRLLRPWITFPPLFWKSNLWEGLEIINWCKSRFLKKKSVLELTKKLSHF